ncbi:MAG: tRNA pseudouridine13 synthase, partial [Parcubacteria group bacterium Gr01-1014_70]
MIITQEERDQERALFESERIRVPHLFNREPMIDSDEYLRWIGIEVVPENRPLGYLRYMPQDFIVEEVSKTKETHTIAVDSLFIAKLAEGSTYYADLVKIGASTLDIITQLAHLLRIEEKQIGYAGIKDRLAITSQLISIRGVENDTIFRTLDEENYFLKNIYRGKGAMANGDLFGNRFLITLRTTNPLSPSEKKHIEDEIKEIRQYGFWNFFYTQRFGT